tara:strand:- start:153 stop:302 length:150 start_codon:yes stop_codon:yes gene_type:complete
MYHLLPPASFLTYLAHLYHFTRSGTLSIEEFKKAMALHPEVPAAQTEQM